MSTARIDVCLILTQVEQTFILGRQGSFCEWLQLPVGWVRAEIFNHLPSMKDFIEFLPGHNMSSSSNFLKDNQESLFLTPQDALSVAHFLEYISFSLHIYLKECSGINLLWHFGDHISLTLQDTAAVMREESPN